MLICELLSKTDALISAQGEVAAKTDALTSAQGEMAAMMQALAASMRGLEERFDQHVAASDDDEDEEDEEEEEEEVQGKERVGPMRRVRTAVLSSCLVSQSAVP